MERARKLLVNPTQVERNLANSCGSGIGAGSRRSITNVDQGLPSPETLAGPASSTAVLT